MDVTMKCCILTFSVFQYLIWNDPFEIYGNVGAKQDILTKT